jgi:ring-1,2-phenylacetyl-CoA epoxidase subunit PaaC
MTEQQALFTYLLRQADNQLILGHRISEWCGKGPVLEEDIALINTSLDFLGQARSLYQEAAKVEDKGRTEDDLAYIRIERDFKNCLICEQPNGHFGDTIARQFFVDAFYYFYYQALENSKNEFLSAFATKSLKEVSYHLRFSSSWLVRLGDGTEESNQKMQDAIDDIWMYTGELFENDEVEQTLEKLGFTPNLDEIKTLWTSYIQDKIKEATLEAPNADEFMQTGGRNGIHSEHLGYVLSELQYLQRAYPNSEW